MGARYNSFVRQPSRQIFGATDPRYPILGSEGCAVAALSSDPDCVAVA